MASNERVYVTEELMLPVVCQDEWYGRADSPTDIELDDARIVRDGRGDPKVVVTVSADVEAEQ